MMRRSLGGWGGLLAAAALGVGVLPIHGEQAMQHKERQPVVRRVQGGGRWFPGTKSELSQVIQEHLAAAKVSPVSNRIIGAISPHAGYVYSGAVAAHVFRAIQEQAERGQAPETVVILGISHRGGCDGVALMDGDGLRTPLGDVALDAEAAALLAAGRPGIHIDYAPHAGEHSAENQVPFVQTVLPKARLVLGIIGHHDPELLNSLIEGLMELARSKKILVLASSDMLHDPDHALVTRSDQASLKQVAQMKTRELLKVWRYDNQIFCGMSAVAVTMLFAERQGAREGIVLRYRNSGDDYPESRGNWVVGYGAVVFPLPDGAGRAP